MVLLAQYSVGHSCIPLVDGVVRADAVHGVVVDIARSPSWIPVTGEELDIPAHDSTADDLHT